MSTISLTFGVHTRNWPRIDMLSFIFGEFGGPRFAELQKGVKIVGHYIKLKTC